MHALLFLALAIVAHVEAGRNYNRFRYERRIVLNGTSGAYTNTTSTTSSTSPTSSTLSPGSDPTRPTSPSNGTSEPENCIGLVTYYGSVPPTVYLTVTEGFEVTVTASNVSVTDSETLITPPPACDATVVPLEGSFQPMATIVVTSKLPLNSSDLPHAESAESQGFETDPPEESTATRKSPWAPEVATSAPTAKTPPGSPQASFVSGAPESPAASFTVIASTVYATAPYTSTVIVTKKTPVVIVSPQTVTPPVFQQTGDPNQNSNPNNPGGGNPDSPSNPPNTNQPPPPPNGPNNANPPAPAPSAGPGAAPGSGPGNTSPGLGNIIVSLIKTQPFAPVPTPGPQTTVANVPIAVLPSSVIIGNDAIPIPKSSEAVVTVAGQVFTVRPSEIAAGSVVVGFDAIGDHQSPSRQVTIAPGVVAQVGVSTAVIAGTTYRIGPGATPTTITVGGVLVGIGPDGLNLPSTTVAANAVTDAPMVVESAGGLTFSIDQSQVIIEGMTYRIGSGAPIITTDIDGQTVSIGPGGVGLETTTLEPTVATALSGTGAAATSSGMAQGSSATRLLLRRIGEIASFAWTVMFLTGGWLRL